MSEQDYQQVDSIISNEELELDNELDNTDDVEALREQIEKDRVAKQQILARAKKAEAELKQFKEKPVEKVTENQTINNNLTADEIDARVLRLQGMSEGTLETLKKVATATGKSIIDAQQDEIFIAIKEKAEREQREANAKLGTSKGSGSVKKTKDFNSQGLSDTEHKELWRASQR